MGKKISKPDYKSFAKDLLKLCKKYNVKVVAYNEGNVYVGPNDGKIMKDFPYSAFECSPEKVLIGDTMEDPIVVKSIVEL